jgi:hypothetical protein
MALFELDDIFGYQQANDIKRLWASDTAPASPGTGEVWMDTLNGNTLKRWNGTSWEPAHTEISSALTGTAGAHADHPVMRLTQTADTTYNLGDIHSEIQFQTKDPGGTFPGQQAYIRTVTTRSDGISNPDAGLVLGTTDVNGDLADRLMVDGEGRIGIGTSSPGYDLDIQSDANAAIVLNRNNAVQAYMNVTSTESNLGTINNYPLRIMTNLVPRVIIDADGDTTVTGNLTAGQMLLPTSQPASLADGSIWIS